MIHRWANDLRVKCLFLDGTKTLEKEPTSTISVFPSLFCLSCFFLLLQVHTNVFECVYDYPSRNNSPSRVSLFPSLFSECVPLFWTPVPCHLSVSMSVSIVILSQYKKKGNTHASDKIQRHQCVLFTIIFVVLITSPPILVKKKNIPPKT